LWWIEILGVLDRTKDESDNERIARKTQNMDEVRMTEKTLVVQHNKIIEARYHLSVVEQRLIKVLVSMISPEDEDFKDYRIRVADMVNLLGITHSNFYRDMHAVAKRLVGNALSISTEDGFIVVSWLAHVEYKEGAGHVELSFSPKLKPYLLQLKAHFTKYELGNIARLRKSYAIRIYELCKQYERIGRRRFEVEELRAILGIEKDEYKSIRDFKRRALLPAQKEVNEKTDINLDIEEEKHGRKILAFVFHIAANKKKEEQHEEKPLSAQEAALMALGVSQKKAQQLTAEYDAAYIQKKIAITYEAVKSGKCRDTAGFVIDAIQQNYQSARMVEKQKRKEEREKRDKLEEQRKKLERLREGYVGFRKVNLSKKYEALSLEEKEQLKIEFLSSQSEIIRKRYEQKGDFRFEDNWFRAFLMRKITVPSMEEYLNAQSIMLSDDERELLKLG
jgi:plasmid replication initiation protein